MKRTNILSKRSVLRAVIYIQIPAIFLPIFIFEVLLFWLEMKSINLPNELPKEIEIFEPIREISNRHKCVSMPFEAIINSIDDYKLKNKN